MDPETSEDIVALKKEISALDPKVVFEAPAIQI